MQGEERSMKGMKIARLALAVAGVLMAGGLASAQGPDGQGPGGQGMEPGRFGQHRPPMERAFGGEGAHGHLEQPVPVALGVGAQRAGADTRHRTTSTAFAKRSLLRLCWAP